VLYKFIGFVSELSQKTPIFTGVVDYCGMSTIIIELIFFDTKVAGEILP